MNTVSDFFNVSFSFLVRKENVIYDISLDFYSHQHRHLRNKGVNTCADLLN